MRLMLSKSDKMRFLVLLVACAAAQAVCVYGATRAQKALITPFSLDAAQVSRVPSSMWIYCSYIPAPEVDGAYRRTQWALSRLTHSYMVGSTLPVRSISNA